MISNSIPSLRAVLVSAAITLVVGLSASASRAQDTGAGFGARVTTDGVTVGGSGVASAESGRDREGVSTSASGDLAMVRLSALTSTGPTGPSGCTPDQCSYGATTTAALWDTVTLTNTTSAALDIPYWFDVDASLDDGSFGSASALVQYYFGDNRARWFSTGTVSIREPYSAGGAISLLANETRTFYWHSRLTATAARGAVSDPTLSFGWSLPEGVTYGSASGAFMAAVPEPSSWALMILGFGSAGAALRARRRIAFTA